MGLFNRNLENKCLDKDVFIKTFLDEISVDEKEKLIDHVLTCEKCRHKFKIMKELMNELAKIRGDLENIELSQNEIKQFRKLAKERIGEIQKRERRTILNFMPIKNALIFTGLIIMILGTYLLVSRFHQKEVYREAGTKQLELLEPIGRISKSPVAFIWTYLEEAEGGHYKFKLIDDELNTIWETGTKTNRLTLPENVRKKLKKGRIYIWKVEAYSDDGRKIDSKSNYFEIK
ncbi:hypothetical protein NLD30_07695 [SCandidatus Aminicenantes bacterium Aminicenantia_JdfR_composite]|nr:hypothetical protein [SCandidatus Aminicenantes bacterium Aminicenantia_JdfR_composite]